MTVTQVVNDTGPGHGSYYYYSVKLFSSPPFYCEHTTFSELQLMSRYILYEPVSHFGHTQAGCNNIESKIKLRLWFICRIESIEKEITPHATEQGESRQRRTLVEQARRKLAPPIPSN